MAPYISMHATLHQHACHTVNQFRLHPTNHSCIFQNSYKELLGCLLEVCNVQDVGLGSLMKYYGRWCGIRVPHCGIRVSSMGLGLLIWYKGPQWSIRIPIMGLGSPVWDKGRDLGLKTAVILQHYQSSRLGRLKSAKVGRDR